MRTRKQRWWVEMLFLIGLAVKEHRGQWLSEVKGQRKIFMCWLKRWEI